MSGQRVWRARWAAIGAAVAVSLGGGGIFFAQAASGPESSTVMVTPVRILDTRNPLDVGLAGPFVSPISQQLQVTGPIPTSSGGDTVVPVGATGVLLNVTVVGATGAGFLSVRPGDASGAPSTSSLNFPAGTTVPNSVQVALPVAGAGAGKIDITYDALGVAGPTADVLVDVVGYTTNATLASLQSQLDALDAKVAPLVNSVAATAGGDQILTLSAADTVVRSISLMPPKDGTVIVNTSAYVKASSAAEVIARCSITTGSLIDNSNLQNQNVPGGADSQEVIGSTRGFPVVGGVLFTANLVCDLFTGTANIRDSQMTALFAPT